MIHELHGAHRLGAGLISKESYCKAEFSKQLMNEIGHTGSNHYMLYEQWSLEGVVSVGWSTKVDEQNKIFLIDYPLNVLYLYPLWRKCPSGMTVE